MKILIATPLFPPDVGGPSYYAKNLAEALREMGHNVAVASFSKWKKFPSGMRHLAYIGELLLKLPGVSLCIALDSFSAGIPAVIAGRMTCTPVIARMSGDFLWERYVERTDDPIRFVDFYDARDRWSRGDKLVFLILCWALRRASGLVFQNSWQKDILTHIYGLEHIPSAVIRNSLREVIAYSPAGRVNFLWAGRDIKLKNLSRLKEAYARAKKENPSIELDMYTSLPQEELFEKIRDSYAVINPSISEMNPNIILEGVSFGKPFISTKETGIQEIVGNLGIFVDPFNVHDISEAMLKLASSEVYKKFQGAIATYKGGRTYSDIANEFLALGKTP